MSELEERALAKAADLSMVSAGKRPRGRLVLELVAMRGKDVVGVRHLVNGTNAWIGNHADTIARLSMVEFGGHPLLLGEVEGGTFAILVPTGARARVHGSDGVPRIVVGPIRVRLVEGERAVLMLGPLQIRARVVLSDLEPRRLRGMMAAVAWVGTLALVYLVALTLSTWLAARSTKDVTPLPQSGSQPVPGLGEPNRAPSR